MRRKTLQVVFVGVSGNDTRLLEEAAARHSALRVENLPGDAPASEAAIASANVIILRRVRWQREHLRAAQQCRVVVQLGAGASCDLEEARELGLYVSSLPGVSALRVADSVTPVLQEYLVSGQPAYRAGGHREFRRPRLGLVGLGRLGRAIAGVARDRKFDLWAHDPFALEEDFIQACTHPAPMLEDVLGISDLVSIQVAPAETNRHMISREEIAVMRKGAWLLNTGWGPAVDADAARAALESGRLARYFPSLAEGASSVSEQVAAAEEGLAADSIEVALDFADRVARGEDPTPLLIDPPCPRWEA